MKMNRYFRGTLYGVAVIQAFFGVVFFLQLPFALQLWPFPDTTPMTYIFIGSIFAAAAASTLWCLIAREDAGFAGIALDYTLIFAPLAVVAFQLGTSTGNNGLTFFAVTAIIGAIFGIYLFMTTRRLPFRSALPLPRLVRWSFIFFAGALVIAGVALVLKTPNILPWTLTPELSVVCGWIFLGAASYFSYSLIRPGWANTGGQLAGFLAYDLVLIVPFLQRLPTIAPELRFSLIFYIIVVSYSGLLAIYYLFINPQTRNWWKR